MKKTINDLYKVAKESNVKLLSTYDAPFWSEYLANSARYDALFNRLYYSFIYFLQDEEKDADNILTDFTNDVYNLLLMHTKEFSELYKIKVLASDSYNPINDYKMTESMDKDKTYDAGARADTSTDTIGAQNNTITNKVSPFDSESFYNDNSNTQNLGTRHDGGTFNKGAQHDASTEDYTLTREGYNGNPVKNLDKHLRFWTNFDFYSYIFGKICEELLLIV